MQAQKTALQAQKIAQKMVSTIQGHAKLWIERVRAYAQALYYRIDEHHLFMFSSGLAFSLLLCIIPLVLIIFFVLGNVLDSAAVRAQLNFFIDSSIPDTSTADFVKALVNTRVQEVVASKKIAGWVGGFGLLFAASGWFTGMRTVLNLIYQVKNAASTVRGRRGSTHSTNSTSFSAANCLFAPSIMSMLTLVTGRKLPRSTRIGRLRSTSSTRSGSLHM